MRILVAYVLLFAVLLPSVSPWGIVAYYQYNKAYIARVLCENRDKPRLHCDGKCYLAKKLKAQQNKQDNETTERVQNTPTLQLFCEEATSFLFSPAVAEWPTRSHFTYLNRPPSPLLNGLFRPPRA